MRMILQRRCTNCWGDEKIVTRIKICGLTNLDDALLAVECGANALGFIFVPNTPRYIGENSDALQIPALLPPFVSKVAVCRTSEEIPAQLLPAFDCIQLYSFDTATAPLNGKITLYAYRIRDEAGIEDIRLTSGNAHALLLDAWSSDKLGGAGRTFNWELACEIKRRIDKPVILAGGLTPENVQEAVERVRPYAVDVSSGVESAPGRKDPEKVRAFCEAVRRANG